MIDLGPFKEFLPSLSKISPFRFEIWNGWQPVLSPENTRQGAPSAKDIKNLLTKIMSQKSFQHMVLNDSQAMFGVPLKDGNNVIGSLVAHGSAKNGNLDTHTMETFLLYLAELIEDKWTCEKETEEMAEELAQSFEDMHLYSRIAAQIKTLRFSGSLLKDLIEKLLETMRVDIAFARLPERLEYNILVRNSNLSKRPFDFDKLAGDLIDLIPSIQPVLSENYFIVNDSKSIPGYGELYPTPFRFLAVRIEHHGEVYGWLGLTAFNIDEIFRQSELSLLSSMAEQIAIVIANTELYHDMERFVINVVRSLVYAIEAKDYYTKGHSERVNRYCMMMAERLRMDPKDKENLHWASILHDVGKIGIPEVILNKPEFLDAEEYGLVKNHPQKGSEILRPIEQLADSLPGVLYHHEWLNGNGYPKGLKGDEIPLMARIIAIADTFDALTTDRAYRNANDSQKALSIMEKVAGSQLDSRLFDIFKEVLIKDQEKT